MCRELFWVAGIWKEYFQTFDIFACFIPFSVVDMLRKCRLKVRVSTQYAGKRAGCVYSERDGSTGFSRGKHRLTVYRAHQVSPRAILECTCCVWLCAVEKFLNKNRFFWWHQQIEIFMEFRLFSKMTRRTFLRSRVIQAQGKSSSRWLVQKL